MASKVFEEYPRPITKKRAAAKLWELGRIAEIVLHESQIEVYEQIKNSAGRIFVLNCSRRWGKSTLLLVLALEQALKFPGSQIRYAAPSAKQAKEIIGPNLRPILDTCPKHLQPRLKTQDKTLVFPNGSEIKVSGTNEGRAEALRGTGMHLGVVDEAGFMDNLKYVINDVLLPQTLTTGGRIIMVSTPPSTLDHPYLKYVEEAKSGGYYAKKTIYDNPMLTKRVIQEIIDATGGSDTNTFLREYMAEFLVDTEAAVIPEFTPEKREELVQEFETPTEPFDAYVSMDPGYVDNTAVLFGFWDFPNAALRIQDEIVENKVTTDKLAAKIKATEQYHWDNKKPYMRVSDTDLIQLADLSTMHGINFIGTQKDNLEAAVNLVRIMVDNGTLIIHPRCKNLIAQLEFAVWNKSRTRFARSADHGHYDALSALIYMARNVSRGKNPCEYGNKRVSSGVNHFRSRHQPAYDTPATDVIRNIFSPKK